MEILTFGFMQRALLSATIIGTVCAIIGVYVVLRGMAFIGAGIAHASFGGVALGITLGVNPLLTTILFCLATAWSIAWKPTIQGKVLVTPEPVVQSSFWPPKNTRTDLRHPKLR